MTDERKVVQMFPGKSDKDLVDRLAGESEKVRAYIANAEGVTQATLTQLLALNNLLVEAEDEIIRLRDTLFLATSPCLDAPS